MQWVVGCFPEIIWGTLSELEYLGKFTAWKGP
jgi:hypothetical protein